MQKPVNLLITDIKMELVKTLGRDQLPISIVAMIVNELHTEVGKQLTQVMAQEEKEYSEAIEKERQAKETISE